MSGLIVVAVVLVVATIFGLWQRRNDGRMKDVPSRPADAPTSVGDDAPRADVHVATRAEHGGEHMRAADLGVEFGTVATFVQFSGPMCAQCGPTRRLLGDIAEEYEGVVHVDVDSEQRMDLVRAYGVMRTPTVLILDQNGIIVKRGVGVPRKVDLVATLGDLADPGN